MVRAYRRPHSRPCCDPALAELFPLLDACGWLLPTVTATAEPAEDADFASRAVLPRCLADILAKGPRVTGGPRRGPAPKVPWRERPAARNLARAREFDSKERWEVPRDLLAGVVLHLAVLRKRYMTYLAIWCHRWHSRRASRAVIPRPVRRLAGAEVRSFRRALPRRLPGAPAEPADTAATRAMDALATAPVAYPDRSAVL